MNVLLPFVFDKMTNWLEATWVYSDGGKSSLIQSTSYHPTQIDILREDALRHKTPLDSREQQISAWISSFVEPVHDEIIGSKKIGSAK